MTIKVEEDFMDYLNVDYMTTEAPLSPPNSIGCSPEKQEDFILDMNPLWTLNDTDILFAPEPKKRGRKKREAIPNMLPKPLAPHPIKEEEKPIVPKEAQLAKRQERLIKNRAAALLSRKRKREHLTSLEDENQKLHDQVNLLEKRVQALTQENLELKKFQWPNKPTKSTSVVFMILFFSFALFTLPFKDTSPLTVGGSFASIDGSGYAVKPSCPHGNCNTDLVLIDSVRPSDLRTWIHRSLQQKENASHLYLYSDEFSQMATLAHSDKQGKPMLSFVSPYNQTEDAYLQIDVQVLGSKVIEGHLIQLKQHNQSSALLKGMEKDLITFPVRKRQEKGLRISQKSRVIS
ncbi:unnamed protein product [Rhizopus stolonifer]